MRLKKVLKYLVFVLTLAGIGFLFSFTNARNIKKDISSINVQFENKEAFFLDETTVNKLLIQNKKATQKLAKSNLDLYLLEKKVLAHPYIESASVYTTIEGELNSVVKERTPIARVLGKSASYYLDKKGVKLPLSERYSARVPFVTGGINEEEIGDVYQLMKMIFEDRTMRKEVVGVHKKKLNDYELIVRSGDYRIEIGELTQLEQKFRNLKAFYSASLKDSIIFNYKTINLKFHNQVVGIK